MAVTFHDNSAAVRAALDAAKARSLEGCGSVLEAFAKQLCPVDTGRLRDSITHEVHGDSTSAGTNVEYAPYVELGTSKMAAKPYLKPALFDNAKTYVDIVKNEYSKL